MRDEACRRWRPSLGAYVLGQLGEDERIAVQAHLDACSGCRAEAAELGTVARLLPSADPSRIERAPAPRPDLADRVLDRVGQARRERTRGWLPRAAATAAAVLAFAAGLFLGLRGDDAGERVTFGVAPAGVTAEGRVRDLAWGTEIEIRVAGLEAGERYAVWLEEPGGDRVPAGTFRAVSGREITVTLAAGLPRGSAVALGVSDEEGATVLLASLV
ncbi:MAG: zf-HC2 domain-containing protein [Actinobacteria bacterium]|nr:zf-HC2 domain-containing protein [Actinomycetota bacterium]